MLKLTFCHMHNLDSCLCWWCSSSCGNKNLFVSSCVLNSKRLWIHQTFMFICILNHTNTNRQHKCNCLCNCTKNDRFSTSTELGLFPPWFTQALTAFLQFDIGLNEKIMRRQTVIQVSPCHCQNNVIMKTVSNRLQSCVTFCGSTDQ